MKRRIVWINIGLALVVIAAAVGAYVWLFAPKTETLTGRTVSVQRGSVSETVTATGTVATAGTLSLSFGTNGTVAKVKVAAGDTVAPGKTLATLDNSSAVQAVANAKSSYVQAVNGTKQTTLTAASAQQALRDAESNAALNKQSYDLAVTTARTNLASAKSKWAPSCLDPAGACPNSDAWAQLRAAEADVSAAKTAYEQAVQTATQNEATSNIKANQASVDLANAQAKQNSDCSTYGSSSQQCSSAVSGVQSAQQQLELAQNAQGNGKAQGQQSLVNADAHITQANIALQKLQNSLAKTAADGLTAARQALDTATLNQEKGLASDQQAIDRARQSLTTSQVSLAAVSTGAGATTSGQAQIDVAKAGLAAAEKSLSQTILKAPVAGTVASVKAVAGQPAAAGATMVTLLPQAPYEVTAKFSEADALKVKVGQKATVTFDALPNEQATGTVTAVDIVPTTDTSNVTTYGTTITLDAGPTGLKQGMAASAVVTANQAADVLWAPTAAITTAGGQSTVTVRKDGKDTRVQVTTGLKGDSGTEITSGVKEGDQLVIAVATTGTGTGFPLGGIPGLGGGGGGGRNRGGGGIG